MLGISPYAIHPSGSKLTQGMARNRGQHGEQACCHIARTPSTAEGAQVLFSDLLKARLKDYLASHPDGYKNTIRI